jgi:dTDP-4-dehydrorhamnose 3,5-epimerase-like enzyme
MSNKRRAVDNCLLIDLNKHHIDRKGSITVVENGVTVPFFTKRVYYLYDVPGSESRGAHAHKELQQLIVAASGSFDVIMDDGNNKRRFNLNCPYRGLLIPAGLWRELDNFSSDAVCLVLASMIYTTEDYIRSYDEYLAYIKEL